MQTYDRFLFQEQGESHEAVRQRLVLYRSSVAAGARPPDLARFMKLFTDVCRYCLLHQVEHPGGRCLLSVRRFHGNS
jgi:hypothetical protein